MNIDIYIFNSTCEMEVANGSKTYDPKAQFVEFSDELSLLPLAFATENDIIISNKIPSDDFLNLIKKTPLQIPTFLQTPEIKKHKELKISNLKPWGWSPLMHQKLLAFKPFCCDEFKNGPVYEWKYQQKELYSRATALDTLKDIIKTYSPVFIDSNDLPVICKTENEVEQIVNQGRKLILKSPWSSSGRGQQTILPNHLALTERQWLKGILRTQGFVMVEYFREKLLDTSLHFEFTNKGIIYLGISAFKTDSKGQYIGNYINPFNHTEIAEYLSIIKHEIDNNNLIETIIKTLSNSIFPELYRGVIGIDVLIYKDNNGSIKINPCMEINCRYTMGTVAISLEKFANKNSKGMFYVARNQNNELFNHHNQQIKTNPIITQNNKIISGYLPLTDITENSKHHAWAEFTE